MANIITVEEISDDGLECISWSFYMDYFISFAGYFKSKRSSKRHGWRKSEFHYSHDNRNGIPFEQVPHCDEQKIKDVAKAKIDEMEIRWK